MKQLLLSGCCIAFCFLLNAQSGAEKELLKIGDKAPATAVYKWIKGEPINQFRNDRVYIVEFGATWCTPCAAAIPHLNVLAKKYADKLEVVSLFVMEYNSEPDNTPSFQYIKKVEEYVNKKGDKMQYHVGVDGPREQLRNSWLKAAGRSGIPAMFIIDKNGRIAWVGANPLLLDSLVQVVLRNDYSIDKMMPAVIKTAEQPGLTNLKDSNLLYVSALSKYKQGQQGDYGDLYIQSYSWLKEGTDQYKELAERRGRINVVGRNLYMLYYMAYGDTLWNRAMSMNPFTGKYVDTIKNPHARSSYGRYWFRPVLEIKDSSLFEWQYGDPKNQFNYMLKMPSQNASVQEMREIMQRDLKTYFKYEVTVEDRMMPCWKLKVKEGFKEKLPAKPGAGKYISYALENGDQMFKNAEVRDIIFQLEVRYGYTNTATLQMKPEYQPPFIDETGIKGKIDYILDKDLLNIVSAKGGRKAPFADYLKLLDKAGFYLEKGEKMMKVIVIKDPIIHN